MPLRVYFIDRELSGAGFEALAGLRAYRDRHALMWDIAATPEAVVAELQDADVWHVARGPCQAPDDAPTDPASSQRMLSLLPTGAHEAHQHLVTCCRLDNASLGALAARYLHDQGYRHGVIVPTLEEDWRRERLAGFREQARALKMDCAVYAPDHDGSGPIPRDERMAAWLREQPKPFALFASRDYMADGFRRWLPEQGFRVPEDVALLGCGDLPVCQLFQPELSSVAYPWRLMGESAARWIHLSSQGGRPPLETYRAMRVITRDTTPAIEDRDSLVRSGMRWLARHLKSSAPAKDLARHLQVSTTYLTRKFRRERRSTPKQEHNRLRLDLATKRLETTRKPLAVIAEECGFTGLTPFGVAFKRRFGCTPGEWRRLHGPVPRR